MLTGATTAPTTGNIIQYTGGAPRCLQGTVRGTGAVSATFLIYGGNDAANVTILLDTMTVTGTTTASDGLYVPSPWRFMRADLSAISGTGAAASMTMGE
jgi:hypothetical protein